MTKQDLAIRLTFSGGIPFVVLTIALLFKLTEPSILSHLLFTYSAIIVSFMAGIHWGAYLFQSAPMNLFIHSNILALSAWASLFIPSNIAFPLLVFCFVYLLRIDHRLYSEDIIQPWYWQLRLRITGVVVACLCFAWLSTD